MATIAELLLAGIQCHQRGDLAHAERYYREVLKRDGQHPDAWHLLGVVASQCGKSTVAIECLRYAISLNDSNPEFHNNLGTALAAQANYEDAVRAFRRALVLQSEFPEACSNLGHVLCQLGQFDEAAIQCRTALRLRPNYAQAHARLGNVLLAQGRPSDAAHCYREALRLNPNLADAHNDLGRAFAELGNLVEATVHFRAVSQLRPQCAITLSNLATALAAQAKLDEALAIAKRAIESQPDSADAHHILGNTLKDLGLADEAVAELRRAVELRPNQPGFHSNLIYALHFQPGCDAATIAAECRRFNERHTASRAVSARPHANMPDPNRRLRVGYVSPDLSRHPVGFFLRPLIAGHDRDVCEVYCYASVAAPDDLTAELSKTADKWRDVAGVSDEALAELVRSDKIDILVDLSAHMAGNRLLAFACRPAPVQVSYLAYCSTTGVRAIDFRLTDPFLDPPGSSDATYSEQSVWLPETYWCYQPFIDLTPAGPLPAASADHVTFGCLNNACKLSQLTLVVWRKLLAAVPGSRLLLHVSAESHRERIRAFFQAGGVQSDRLEFIGLVPINDYFQLYDQIDVGLDPFPYGGGTTTCDALWMGVPVICLHGSTAVGRAGASILSNVGLPELVARTPAEYFDVAVRTAGDLDALAATRRGLRECMLASPLCDTPRFVRAVENAYRQMWRAWCAQA